MSKENPTAGELRESEAKLAKMQKMGRWLLGGAVLGWLLFFYKMSQTSEMALRYSDSAKEEIGTWSLVLIVWTLIALGMVVLSKKFAKIVGGMKDGRKEALRTQLASADDNQRAQIESELRELGA